MKYPFDMYRHLLLIDRFYDHPAQLPHVNKYYWHYVWAHLFRLLGLDNTTIFLRAHIIHYVQTLLSTLLVFLASRILIRNLFLSLSPIFINFLAFDAVIVWLVVFATASEGQHLVWMQWYSLTYQITLPITYAMLGALFYLLFERHSVTAKIVVATLFVIGTTIVLTIHSMEFVYFMLYVSVLTLLYADKLMRIAYTHRILTAIAVLFLVAVLYNIKTLVALVSYKMPPILTLLTHNTPEEILGFVRLHGITLLNGVNRAWAAVNLLDYIAIGSAATMVLKHVRERIRHRTPRLRTRIALFLLIASLFVEIPLHVYSAGIASLVTDLYLVNRFYYSALLFIALPAALYYLFTRKDNTRLFTTQGIFVALLLGSIALSKYCDCYRHNLYKNVHALLSAFDERKVGFNLLQPEIDRIGEFVERYKRELPDTAGVTVVSIDDIFFLLPLPPSERYPTIYTREDIAFVLRHVYRLPHVYLPYHWNGTRIDPKAYLKAYRNDPHPQKRLLEVPKAFPPYRAYR